MVITGNNRESARPLWRCPSRPWDIQSYQLCEVVLITGTTSTDNWSWECMIIIRQWNSFKTNFKNVQMTSQEYYMYVVCTASIPEAEARSSACAEIHSHLWRPASPHHDWGDSSVGRKCWDQRHQTMEHSSCSHTDQPVTHVQKHWFKKLKKESNRNEWVHNQRNSAKRGLKSQHFSC